MSSISPIRDPKSDHLLSPENSALVIIDYQSIQVQSIGSMNRNDLVRNITEVAKLAVGFKVPVILSSVNVETGLNTPTIPQLTKVLGDIEVFDRTSINAYEDKEFKEAVDKLSDKKIIICALWTEACLTFPAIDLLKQGKEVYTVVDAIGGTSKIAHETALRRMELEGLKPISLTQLSCEWQRDWNRKETVPVFSEALVANGSFLGETLKKHK